LRGAVKALLQDRTYAALAFASSNRLGSSRSLSTIGLRRHPEKLNPNPSRRSISPSWAVALDEHIVKNQVVPVQSAHRFAEYQGELKATGEARSLHGAGG